MVDHDLKPGTRVVHVGSGDHGEVLGFDSEGRVRVQFDVDPPGWADHLDVDTLEVIDR